MKQAFDLSGVVVLVTGGTKGVGRGITERFLGAGARVTVCARTAPEKPIRMGENEAVFLPANVRRVEEIDRVVEAVVKEFGRLDALINNAGGSPPADAATASPKFSASIIDLNLTAPLNFAQRANAVMQRQSEGGSIVNIASVSGVRASPGTAAYGAAKAGLLSLTQSLAVEWAPRVRVNAVVAGMIRTEQAELHYGSEAGIRAAGETVPLGRLGEPEDVGDVCLFLCSEMARYVSGAQILLHGGGERPAFLDAVKANVPGAGFG
jgi:NAD(P)-dependent dehydrogenase (short-subunit alcohol dehydrogenase family)